jgi:hypothetical protein
VREVDEDRAARLQRYRQRFGDFKQAPNEGDVTHEVRRTEPLRLGERVAGSIDNVSEALAAAEGDGFR